MIQLCENISLHYDKKKINKILFSKACYTIVVVMFSQCLCLAKKPTW